MARRVERMLETVVVVLIGFGAFAMIYLASYLLVQMAITG